MDIKTYRAKTMRDALELVRRELGPSAAVLHTREVNSGALSRLVFGRQYEVAARAAVNVPSRLPEEMQEVPGAGGQVPEHTFSVGRAAEPIRGYSALPPTLIRRPRRASMTIGRGIAMIFGGR